MPLGGHTIPTSIVGTREASKKAQKKEIKKKTSDRINRSIAQRRESSNLCVWYPIRDSRLKSFHHRKTISTVVRVDTSTI